MLAFASLLGHHGHPTRSSALPGFLVIVAFALGGLVILGLVERALPGLRRRSRARRRARRRLVAAAGTERRIRAQMDELCPDGWQAQITLFSNAEDLPEEAPQSLEAHVALDWLAVDRRGFEEPVIRRIWAGSINDALDAMVSERMTDTTLSEIESRASADGAQWPDQATGAS